MRSGRSGEEGCRLRVWPEDFVRRAHAAAFLRGASGLDWLVLLGAAVNLIVVSVLFVYWLSH